MSTSKKADPAEHGEDGPIPKSETELFAPLIDPQYFGTGSYSIGGSNQEACQPKPDAHAADENSSK
jgi:hypothetical protein